MSLFDLLGSNTLRLAVEVVTLLGRANLLGEGKEWVYNKLSKRIKERATYEEFEDALIAGEEFIKAIWNLLHK